MNYIVTGGLGFIGSHLAEKLLNGGHKVTVIDNLSTGSYDNLKEQRDNPNLFIQNRDIRSELTDIFGREKIDAVFHLGGLAGVQPSIQDPAQSHDVNVNGSLNILEACRKYGIKRIIFSSSAAVYGNQETLPIKENLPKKPLSPYALHKITVEHYCSLYHQLYGLEAISLRYFNVFGPRQNPEGAYSAMIPKFISLIQKNIAPKINGDGEQTRDFVYVSDVVDSNILAANTKNKDCFGQSFNIGSGIPVSVNQITQSIIKLSNKNLIPLYGPAVTEIRNSLSDTTKARVLLHWSPKILLETGIKKTYEFFTQNTKLTQQYL